MADPFPGRRSAAFPMQGKAAHDKAQRKAPASFTSKRHALPPPDDPPEPPALDGDVMGSPSSLGADIPPHVWAMLQQAGEMAAARLVQILQSPRFASYAPSAQRGLIELALTRAYGLPIRKALNVNLSTSDSDAVAASLADLAANLPENARNSVREALNASNPDHPSRNDT